MKSVTLVAAAAGIAAAALAARAGAEPDANLPTRVSEKIVADLARADLYATSADASKYLGQSSAENLKNSTASRRSRISVSRNIATWSMPAITGRQKRT